MQTDNSSKTIRQQILLCAEKLKDSFPVVLPDGYEYSEPDGSPITGTLFNQADFFRGQLGLVSNGNGYFIPQDQVPASKLMGIIIALFEKHCISICDAVLNQRVNASDGVNANTMLQMLREFRPYKDRRAAAGRQVYENMLILGGPWSPDETVNDGCGTASLMEDWSEAHKLPYVLFESEMSRPIVNAVDTIHWVAKNDRIFVILSDSVSEKGFRFEVFPNGYLHAHQENADIDIPTESLLRLEAILWRQVIRKQAHDEEVKRSKREIQPLGTLHYLTIKELIREKGGDFGYGRRGVSFNRKSFDYQADIPHIRTVWGGTAAISDIWIDRNPAGHHEEVLVIRTFPVCTMQHTECYNGFEDEPWDRILSQVYTELQTQTDPEWEEWVQSFRERLENKFDEKTLQKSVEDTIDRMEKNGNGFRCHIRGFSLPNDGFPMRSMPGNARLIAVGVSDGSIDYEAFGISRGKIAYSIDDNGHLYLSDGKDIALPDIICALNIEI